MLPDPNLCQTLVRTMKFFRWLLKSHLLLLWPVLPYVFFILHTHPTQSRAWPSCSQHSSCTRRPSCAGWAGRGIGPAARWRNDAKQRLGRGGLNIGGEKVRNNLTLTRCWGFTVDFWVPGLPVICFGAAACVTLRHLFSCQAVTVPALVEAGSLKPAPHLHLQIGCPFSSLQLVCSDTRNR